MKTFTQVVLPIAALAGLVFGITYILNYSSPTPPPKKTEDGKDAGKDHNEVQHHYGPEGPKPQ